MNVVVDTNALVYAAKHKVDLGTEIARVIDRSEVFVPDCVLIELEKLSKSARKGAEKDAAKLALQLVKHYKFKTLKLGEGHCDDLILNWIEKNSGVVITNDSGFRARLKNVNVKTLAIRQKRLLAYA